MPLPMSCVPRHFAMYRKEEAVTFKYPMTTNPRMNFGRTLIFSLTLCVVSCIGAVQTITPDLQTVLSEVVCASFLEDTMSD
jgi:hypothetical protein